MRQRRIDRSQRLRRDIAQLRVRRTDRSQRLRRIDLHHMRTDRTGLGRPTIRPDGSMIVQGYIAREGIMEYGQPDGSVLREFVSASTLRATMDGLVGLPVTVEHPADQFGNPIWVDPDNYADFAVGSVLAVSFDEEEKAILADLSIMRRDVIEAVREGKVELSPGYDADVVRNDGNNDHGVYNAQQTWRGYNHVAFVDDARGGSTVRARVDSAGNVTGNGAPAPSPTPRGQTMNPNLVALAALVGLTETFTTDNEAISAIRRKVDADKSANAAKDQELAQFRADATDPNKIDPTEHERLKTENSELKTRIDAIETERKMDALAPMVKAYRVEVANGDTPDDVFANIASKITGERVDSKTADMAEIRGMVRGHYFAKFGGPDNDRRRDRDDRGDRDPFDEPPSRRTRNDNRDPWGDPVDGDSPARRSDGDRHRDGRRAGEDAWSDAFERDTGRRGRRDRQDDPADDRWQNDPFRPGPSALLERHADAAFNGSPQRD